MIALLPSLSLPVFLLNFPTSCNPFLSVCSARLAIYCDGVLRGEKGVAEDEATAKLTALMALFRLVAAKDVFEAFYKSSLAKRLLSNKSQSFDLEVWEREGLRMSVLLVALNGSYLSLMTNRASL